MSPPGSATEDDVIVLATVTAESLAAEATAGLHPEPARAHRADVDHVGSEVVVLRG